MRSRPEPAEPPSAIARAARTYVARGWSVIPMQPLGKRPIIAWRDAQQHPASVDTVDRWFTRWPDANVGIVTGRVSGLAVIDVDARHGGPASVAEAEAVHGPLPPTVEALTGGGGRHLYFLHPGTPVANRVAMRPGIDLRGDGGCVVAPPSVHPNGRRYAWVAGRGPGEIALAPLPPHFDAASNAVRPIGHSHLHWRRLVREGVDEGARNNTLASLTGHLLQRGVDLDVVAELMLAWNRTHCRPPLPDAEVLRVLESIARLHGLGPVPE